jgi:imidazolonepropionase-like amidohydrolase
VTVAFGTDASQSIRNGNNAVELASLVTLGFSPEEVLLMATRNAAAALGLGDRLGTLQPGKRADFLIVRGNPLGNIDLLREPGNIRAVFLDGGAKVLRDAAGEEYQSQGFASGTVAELLKG